jgi:hypothetical protein
VSAECFDEMLDNVSRTERSDWNKERQYLEIHVRKSNEDPGE